ncbi:MAG: GtrA family protein [Nocardioidaceae bacterium]
MRSQALRFIAVGAFTAVTDFGTYRALLALGLPITPAKACGFVVGTTLSYLLNRAWTFGARRVPHAVGRFLAVYAVTLVVNVAVNAACVSLLSGIGGRITLSWLAAQAVASALNFIGMRYVVFPQGRAAPVDV